MIHLRFVDSVLRNWGNELFAKIISNEMWRDGRIKGKITFETYEMQ